MALDEVLGWLGDLIAQHIYRDDVPLPMRRRWSLDGDGWQTVDDPDDEVVRISLTEAGGGESGNVPSPDTANEVLRTVDGSTIEWGKIENAQVATAAAIAGTKIAPDFGAQDIVTTGVAKIGATPAATGSIRLGSSGSIKAAGAADRRLIDCAAGSAVDVGDPAIPLNLFGTERAEDLSATNVLERKVHGAGTSTGTGDVIVEYETLLTDGVYLAIADVVLRSPTGPAYAAMRIAATVSVASSVAAVVDTVTTIHDKATAAYAHTATFQIASSTRIQVLVTTTLSSAAAATLTLLELSV